MVKFARTLITGGTSGVGAAVMARLLQHAPDGCSGVVTLAGRHDGAHIPFDIERDDMDTMAERIRQSASGDPFDQIVHCAGSELVQPLARMTHEKLERQAGAAKAAMALLVAAAKPGVMRDGGAIVMMSSVAAHRGVPCMAA